MISASRRPLLCVALLATGCFPELSSSTGADASTDGAADVARDTSADVAADARDASAPDAPAPDAAADAAVDVSTDTARDVSVDSGTDAPADAPADVSADVANDTAADVASDTAADAVVDAPPMCSAPDMLCAGRCVAVSSDALNCGSCGTVCPTGQPCMAGRCMPPCATGFSLCGLTCVDTRTSSTNCGACGNTCATGRSCVAGVCTLTCATGQTACGDVCVNLQSSAANCGACGRACTSTQTCSAGMCVTASTAPFGAPVHDHQRAIDGTQAMIGRTGNDLILRCQRADGSLVRADQTVATTPNFDTSGSATQVRIGGRSNTVLVTWMALETAGSYSTRQFWGRVYDSACAPVTEAFRWPAPPSGEYVPDVAMARDGRFVLAWKQDDIRVGFYSARGVLEGQLTFPTRTLCPGGGYGLHVALNPESGDGIVTCQQHASNPIYYQRFSAARALVDAAPVRVAQSESNRSSWYESHVVGMNADGAFAIEWQDSSARTYVANFYDRTGALLRTATVAPITESLYWDGFRQTHQAVELLGADFVLRTGQYSSPAWAVRYSAAGARLGCASVPNTLGPVHTLRANGATTLTMSSGTTVRVNPISLADAIGCP